MLVNNTKPKETFIVSIIIQIKSSIGVDDCQVTECSKAK